MSVAHDRGGFGPYTAEDLHAREDEGKGLELADGWPVEMSASSLHNWVSMQLWEFLRAAAPKTEVFAAIGGEWEINTLSGLRKPDVFLVPKDVARESIVKGDPRVIPGHELLLVGEVISPGSGSERTDRVRKLEEYAALGIPQYWIVDFTPVPMVQVFTLDDLPSYRIEQVPTYRLEHLVRAGEVLEVEVEADKPFTVRFDPQELTEF
ncbi:Uma2 family endonuclease [Actinomadura litoris]|uniref:Uma2 family endonuclease n=1 Tax=Actinomadura litoris TaxID=2678616 RepID=UPI001FA6F571|nr:Uma2 family endonuclease [Actinomadura litoris]